MVWGVARDIKIAIKQRKNAAATLKEISIARPTGVKGSRARKTATPMAAEVIRRGRLKKRVNRRAGIFMSESLLGPAGTIGLIFAKTSPPPELKSSSLGLLASADTSTEIVH